MNTIIKTLRSEINIKKSQAEKNGRISEENELYYVGRFDLCHELLSVLSDLEKSEKQTTAEGLEEEIKRWLKEGKITDTRYDDYGDNDIEATARHFAQWGAEHRGNSETPKDLEEAAKSHRSTANYGGDINLAMEDSYKKGAKWQKEQMMKEAVEGIAVINANAKEDGFGYVRSDYVSDDVLRGLGKFKIIIVKEDK